MHKNIPSYLHNLRAETKAQHQATENMTEGHRFLEGQFEVNHCRRLLQCHYLYHLSVAEQVKQHPFFTQNPILDWPKCERIPALEEDLQKLDGGIKLKEQLQLTSAEEDAFIVGLVYVSEGSVLGNRQLHKAMQKQDSFVALGADHFFRIAAGGLAERWKSFLQLMHPYGMKAETQLIQGANAGFNHFKEIWQSLN